MKPLHEQEIEEARKKLASIGCSTDNFAFDVEFMEPDPDGGGMYTVRYEITVTNNSNGKSSGYIGGIGMHWVDAFEEALSEGAYD